MKGVTVQPLINLKQFLAVLVLVIVTAVFLTAYFRNFQPESEEQQASGRHHGAVIPSMPGGWQCPNSWQCLKKEGVPSGTEVHSKMDGMNGGEGTEPASETSPTEGNETNSQATSAKSADSETQTGKEVADEGQHTHSH